MRATIATLSGLHPHVGEEPCDDRRNPVNRDEGAQLIEQRNTRVEHADGAVDLRGHEPDHDEDGGAGLAAHAEQAGTEIERGQHHEADDGDHHDMHATPLHWTSGAMTNAALL